MSIEEPENTTKPGETPDASGRNDVPNGASDASDGTAPSGTGHTDDLASNGAELDPSVEGDDTDPFGVGLEIPTKIVPVSQPDPTQTDTGTSRADSAAKKTVSGAPDSAEAKGRGMTVAP